MVTEPERCALALAVVGTIEVGRDCTGLLLVDPAISRRHLALVPHEGHVLVSDLGSTNGSWIADRPLEARHRLVHGEIVRFGHCTIELVAGQPALAVSNVDLRSTSIGVVADDVLTHGLPNPAPDAGTITIVFSDIESSTVRAVELGDLRWHDLLGVHNQIVRRMVSRHGGTEVKSQGDGFMLCFRSARAALACMSDVQRALAAHEMANPLDFIRVRVGLHTGEAVVGDGGDLFGRHVILAARIADQARGGEIVISDLVREIVEPRGDTSIVSSRTVRLKGLTGEHIIHSVRW